MEQKIKDFLKLSADYYKIPGNGAGGKLHIVLDDDNLDDSSIFFCKEKCVEASDNFGLEICDLLLSIPLERRLWLDREIPSWSEGSFYLDYEEFEGEEIKTGDFVKAVWTHERSGEQFTEIFIAGKIIGEEIKIENDNGIGFYKHECVKIKI